MAGSSAGLTTSVFPRIDSTLIGFQRRSFPAGARRAADNVGRPIRINGPGRQALRREIESYANNRPADRLLGF